ncbi:OLC1v1020382C1 [Oldenlandia corymbosa var. corymbosa]|uniref:OLC1v1020382C1 n=1 Tax=Oldenlandia corymbosa var. corymbosa TaxID=529605 RepID=A0AAV1EGT1_OLDCO|nr:OLC1v1020382C1 [Oldenlandia corymbosa var. corymbosa]
MEKCEIEGYEIPVGTKVFVNAWAINRDREYWEAAELFTPERFQEMNGIDTMGTNFEYIPFGGGKRMCPGTAFSSAVMELALAQLLYHFDWEIPRGIKPECLNMTEMLGASLKRKNNLCLVPTVHFSI